MSNGQKFYGKYRGTVLNNLDPLQLGRVQIQAPDVGGLIPGSWAMPCFPFTGKQMGAYMIPQIGTGIWVGASTSTVVLLIALCAGSGIVMFLLAHKAPAKSVADILYSIEAKDGRR